MSVEAPDRIPTTEGRETFTISEYSGALPRLLKGGSLLNPKYVSDNITETDIESFDNRNYSPFTHASSQERQLYWQEQEIQVFSEQKNAWMQNTTRVFENSREWFITSNKGQRWNELFSQIGIDSQSFDANTAQSLFDRYFDASGRNADIKRFVHDVLSAHKNEGGTIDMDRLKQSQDAIQWLGNIFGEQSSQITTLLATGEGLISTDEGRQHLIESANQQEENTVNPTPRINRLSERERSLLSFIHASQPHVPTPDEVQTVETIPAAEYQDIIPEEIPPEETRPNPEPEPTKQTEQTEEDQAPELSFEEMVEKLVDFSTGRVTEARLDQSEFFPAYVNEIRQLVRQNESAFSAENPTIILSPVAKVLLSKIAEESNNKDQELAFTLRGVPFIENGKMVYVIAFASPSMDFSQANRIRVEKDPQLEADNARKLVENMGLASYIQDKTNTTTGRFLVDSHTHQESLGENNRTTPSSTGNENDYTQIEQYLRADPYRPFTWGISTKWRGNVETKVWHSRLQNGNPIHTEISLLSPEDVQNLKDTPYTQETILRRHEENPQNIDPESNAMAAAQFISVLRDQAKLTVDPTNNRYLMHEYGPKIVAPAENGWFEGFSTLDAMEKRYNLPLAMYIQRGHARLLLKPPYQNESGEWQIKVWDPMQTGEQEIPIPEYDPSTIIPGPNEGAYKRTALSNAKIYSNNKGFSQIREGEYDLSFSNNPDLAPYTDTLTSAKLQRLQVDAHNCIPYSAFVGVMLNAMKEGNENFKTQGLRQFYEDFGIRVLSQGELFPQRSH